MSSSNSLDFTCYYNESSDEYHIPKDEQDELVELIEALKKENKQLNDDLEPLTDAMTGWTGVCDFQDVVDYVCREQGENRRLKFATCAMDFEMEKLKEENKELILDGYEDSKEQRHEIDELKKQIKEKLVEKQNQTKLSYQTEALAS